MKSWRCRTLLFACLILIRLHLSEAACADYFKLSQWTSEHNSPITMETLTETFQLVDAENLKNIMICTLQNELLTNKRNVRHLLRHCLEVKDEKDIQVKCGNITHHKVYFYDFMCLVAKASGLPAEVCVKESVTKWLDSKLTTTPPPTTITAATAPPPPPTTATAATTTTTTAATVAAAKPTTAAAAATAATTTTTTTTATAAEAAKPTATTAATAAAATATATTTTATAATTTTTATVAAAAAKPTAAAAATAAATTTTTTATAAAAAAATTTTTATAAEAAKPTTAAAATTTKPIATAAATAAAATATTTTTTTTTTTATAAEAAKPTTATTAAAAAKPTATAAAAKPTTKSSSLAASTTQSTAKTSRTQTKIGKTPVTNRIPLRFQFAGTTAPVQSNPTSTAPTNTVYAVLVISLLLNVVFLLWVLFFRERSKSKPNHSPQMNGSPEIMNLVQRQPEMHDETHSNEDATTALRVNNDVQANCKDENQV